MTSQQRTRAIKKFHEKPKIHVMILGLKAGGVGLNLTCANRGILVYVSVCFAPNID
jgi:SNF2 family DNA or RNA helicase